MTKPASHKSKPPSAADALAAATTLALAGTKASTVTSSSDVDVPGGVRKASDLTRATITLRTEDEAMLDRIEDYLRGYDRRTRLPRAALIQIAVRSVQIGPKLLEIAKTVRAQDARGKKKTLVHTV